MGLREKILKPVYRQILDYLEGDDADFVYGSLNIDHFGVRSLSRFRFLYQHIRENHQDIPGDIYEFGVFRGASLLSMALLLKGLGSSKFVYGFDSFQGFPGYHQKDAIENFNSALFSDEIRSRVKILANISAQFFGQDISANNASGSGDFSDTSFSGLQAKIKALGLDNVELIKGDFRETIPEFFLKKDKAIFAANIDCDLYEGYAVALPNVWENLSPNGYIHLDEYYSLKFPGAKISSDEFFCSKNIIPKMHTDTRPGEFERWYVKKEP